ncbi:hypothetical protein L2E82_18440 [Cichorium intybus]|uniref:Uncharacterized protein n=1 Tax=Cichorium intybus TaxID=13427 RepID=A0ACB9FAP0_CICIN|nr:hypothetical protein L2E82_18440 [Cichorium intybus]
MMQSIGKKDGQKRARDQGEQSSRDLLFADHETLAIGRLLPAVAALVVAGLSAIVPPPPARIARLHQCAIFDLCYSSLQVPSWNRGFKINPDQNLGRCKEIERGKEGAIDLGRCRTESVSFCRESFVKKCESKNLVEIERKGFDTWKNVSSKELIL